MILNTTFCSKPPCLNRFAGKLLVFTRCLFFRRLIPIVVAIEVWSQYCHFSFFQLDLGAFFIFYLQKLKFYCGCLAVLVWFDLGIFFSKLIRLTTKTCFQSKNLFRLCKIPSFAKTYLKTHDPHNRCDFCTSLFNIFYGSRIQILSFKGFIERECNRMAVRT